MSIRLSPPFAFALGLASSCAAWAAEPPAAGIISQTGGWIVTLKANAVAGPKYPGASDMGFIAYPSGSIRRADAEPAFSTPDDGLSWALYDTAAFKAGAVLRYQPGRYDGANRELRGIRDARWAVEPGVFAEYWPVKDVLRTRFELRRGFHGHEGVVATLGADVVQKLGALTLSAGPRVNLADSDYMRSYFGVTPRDAAWNPRVTAYRPKGGLKSLGASTAATYQWSPNVATTAYATYERLAAEPGKSPLVKAFGSRNQITIGATLSYSFSWSGL